MTLLRPITRQLQNRSQPIRTVTVREFDGGWNVIDNDLNLSSRFGKKLENVYRAPDGSIAVRWGTRYFADVSDFSISNAALGTDPLETVLSSAVVEVTHVGHGLLTGHAVTVAGAVDTGGISAANINGLRIVTVIDADTYSIVADSAASSAVTGGGAGITIAYETTQLAGTIINIVFFQNGLIVVDSNGEIAFVDGQGNVVVIFNSDMAAKLTGSPAGWSATEFCSFAVFDNRLLVANGIDKPLEIDLNRSGGGAFQPVQYIVDAGTGANTNVPIGRYITAMNSFVIIAGNPVNPDRLHISMEGTFGTWVGDPGADNNAVNIDLSKKVGTQFPTIRGIGRFRERLVVVFEDVTAVGTLGIFNSADEHIPEFSDVIDQQGALSHRSLVSVGDDMFMADVVGVPSLQRALFTGGVRGERASQLIDPEIQKLVQKLTIGESEDLVYAVFNQLEGQYMLFVPNETKTERHCFVYTTIRALKVAAWSRFRGWNWSCAAKSQLGRVFFAEGAKLYVYGSVDDPIYADKVNDPALDEPTEGTPITFDWELPWADLDTRVNLKKVKYLQIDAKGTAEFQLCAYIDNIVTDGAGDDDPTLSMGFVGGDSGGYGGGDQPYGGGRRTADERPWSWTVKFKIIKLRFRGAVKKPLRFVSFSLAYQPGSIRR